MPKHFTVAAAAEYLDVTDDKVLAWLHSGELIGVNVAISTKSRPKWRISEAAIEKFLLARQTVKAEPRQKALRKPVSAGTRTYY